MAKALGKILAEAGWLTGGYFVAPKYVSLLITWRCNFRCASCSIWQKTDYADLADEDWLAIASDLKQSLPPDTLIEINGGEALLLKPKVLKLIKSLAEYFEEVNLTTNGSLITPEVIKDLSEAGLRTIKVSLYSLEPDTHDALRGFAGAQARALAAIKLAAESNLKVEVGVLLTGKNISQLPALLTYLKTLSGVSAILQPLDESVESSASKNLSANSLPAELWPEPAAVKTFFAWLGEQADLLKNSPANLAAIEKYYLQPESVLVYRCFASQKNLIIYPDGQAAFCFKTGAIGNLREKKLADILRGAGAKQTRRAIKTCSKYCRIVGCNFNRGFKEWFKDKFK